MNQNVTEKIPGAVPTPAHFLYVPTFAHLKKCSLNTRCPQRALSGHCFHTPRSSHILEHLV